jgi:uncharacterized protein (DUF697 family)/predicted GTPase
MFAWLKRLFAAKNDGDYQQHLDRLLKEAPIPVLWLVGKTQSGKTTLIKHLTGADDAEIGSGFRPCTRFSREYRFPTAEAPLLSFLDTRGLEEPGYDPAEDLERFNDQAHVMIVTVRLLDFAVDRLVQHVRTIRDSQPTRPVLVAVTCLHEAYPQEQHVQPYPFTLGRKGDVDPAASIPDNLRRALDQQHRQFDDLCDYLVPLDITPPEEGFTDPAYGGQRLKEMLIDALPAAYRHTLINLEEATQSLQDYFERRALPHILGFSSLAATAGAIPIPWVDLFILPGIQTQMIFHLARLYGQPLTGQRFMELASTLGLGMLVRQGIRELTKFIPIIGSLAGATLAGSATFALGKAFCYYYSAVHKGHVPKAEELKQYYREQLAQAEKLWARQ